MRFFTGSYVHKVDAKGRVSLPVLFRKTLTNLGDEWCVVVPNYTSGNFHVGFSQSGHEAAVAAVEGDETLSDEEADAELDLLSAEAHAMQPDDAGRIVLPREMREALGIGGEVMFRGRGSHFEIWNPETRAEVEAEKPAAPRPRPRLRKLH